MSILTSKILLPTSDLKKPLYLKTCKNRPENFYSIGSRFQINWSILDKNRRLSPESIFNFTKKVFSQKQPDLI